MGKPRSREGSRAQGSDIRFSHSTYPLPRRSAVHESSVHETLLSGNFCFWQPHFLGGSRALLSEPQPASPASAIWVFIDLSSDPLTGSRTPAP